jgi:ATP-dependent DNA helicase RecQ
MSQRRLEAILQPLADLDLVAVTPTGDVDGLGAREADARDPDWAAAAAEVIARHERRHRIEQSRVTMIRSFAEAQSCRRQYLLNYLGEEFSPPCDACDNCRSGRTAALLAAGGDDTFTLDDAVRHARWGAGRVVRVEGDRVVVLFDDVGYKTLANTAVVEQGLLTRVA